MKQGSLKYEYTTKLVLTVIYLAALAAILAFAGQVRLSRTIENLTVLDLGLFGLATFRLGRLAAYDRVMEPVRSLVAQTVPDPTGAGDTVEPKGEGLQQALGQLVSCPICAGTWIASGLMYIYIWFPAPVQIFLWVTAAVGLAEFLNTLVEALCWTGERNRVLTGGMKRQTGGHTVVSRENKNDEGYRNTNE